jgi:hypothetical protein
MGQDSSQKWTIADRIGLVGGLAGLVGGVAGILSFVVTCRMLDESAKSSRVATDSLKVTTDSLKVATESLNRAAGKVKAKFAVESPGILTSDIPKDFWVHSSWSNGTQLRYSSLEQMRNLRQFISIRNTGEEPIEDIRIVVKLFNTQLIPDEQMKRWDTLMPLITQYSERDDCHLSRKLQPGKVATIQLARYFLAPMLKYQSEAPDSKSHQGMFLISCFAKIPGATSFDEAEKDGRISFLFEWDPKGFPEDKSKKFIADCRDEISIRSD